ncbi:MAG: HU-CCDC81 and SPOR domain-containing protein [Prolixibacteraceae bacterium]|nr:HU-CCDC81 and SPOR domain-containing protein [Prolixibacteraceae bacterium]MBT6005864.1 HU-CCDC81 and SPOR domain-containing protein [Prolixibacteraceae bacterium]MBT6763860.1 HU-CCDC81 and SPOR domain-containing protein [Prolixibacteraceae bacterium]MBT6997100.1 HU-CCDC81 and SPOR domain-containing protein [Prolixibacteraceae bacterium]MBT7393367.1 HU-CCDC81 and SPOR domain-containing protein [Prolixibacteraceae bacterium]
MKFGNYIRELILAHETVIIPGFGAFISNYKPAGFDSENDNILPPSKEISFNQKIRNNDGLLVGYIAESDGISHFDALKKIEKERENIIYQLDKGEKVTLENTGILFFDENHKIQFEPFQKDNLLLDSFGLEATSLKTTVAVDLEKELVVKNDEPEIINSDNSIIETEPEIADQTIGTIPEKETGKLPEPKPEKEKKRSWLWYFLILIPIIIAGWFVITKEKNTPKDEVEIRDNSRSTIIPEKMEKSIPTIDSTGFLTTDSTQFIEEKIDSTELPKPDSPIYYLVGGSFKKEENADKYLQQLKKEGYEPFHFGKRGNFYIIGIGKYNSEEDASAAKNNFLKKNPGSGIWIFKE